MQVIKNGRKRRVYFTAAERRALAYAARTSRCPKCGRLDLWTAGGNSGLNCDNCSWYAVYGKDVFVTFVVLSIICGETVRVSSMTLTNEVPFFQRDFSLDRTLGVYGKDIAL